MEEVLVEGLTTIAVPQHAEHGRLAGSDSTAIVSDRSLIQVVGDNEPIVAFFYDPHLVVLQRQFE